MIGDQFETALRNFSCFNSDDPDVLREDASRIDSLGEIFDVLTGVEVQELEEHADEVESEGGGRADEDTEGPYRSVGNTDCSDSELDSMFGTLGSS